LESLKIFQHAVGPRLQIIVTKNRPQTLSALLAYRRIPAKLSKFSV
jgi:hypothetical protein